MGFRDAYVCTYVWYVWKMLLVDGHRWTDGHRVLVEMVELGVVVWSLTELRVLSMSLVFLLFL